MFNFLKKRKQEVKAKLSGLTIPTSRDAWDARAKGAGEVKPDAVRVPEPGTEAKPRYSCKSREPGVPRAKREHLNKAQVLEGLQSRPEILKASRVVGAWIWIDDKDFPSPDDATRKFLTGLGFRHNGKRDAWQNSCGKWFGSSKEPKPVIYAKYGQVPATEYLGLET